jgi:hypothetical protein
MNEFVGVRSWIGFSANPSVKREALMFKRIAIPHLKPVLALAASHGEYYFGFLAGLISMR